METKHYKKWWIYSEGYVMLPRKLLTNNYWTALSPLTRDIFILALGRCNHAPKKWDIGGGRFINIERGQWLTSLGKIKKLCGNKVNSIKPIRTALKALEGVPLISNKSYDGEYRIITILDYNALQTHKNYETEGKVIPVGDNEELGKPQTSDAPKTGKRKQAHKGQGERQKGATNNNVINNNVNTTEPKQHGSLPLQSRGIPNDNNKAAGNGDKSKLAAKRIAEGKEGGSSAQPAAIDAISEQKQDELIKAFYREHKRLPENRELDKLKDEYINGRIFPNEAGKFVVAEIAA